MRKTGYIALFAAAAATAGVIINSRPDPAPDAPAPVFKLPRPAAPPAPALVPLNPGVASLLETAARGDFQSALAAAGNLPAKLPAGDTAALLEWTMGPRPAKLSGAAWFALVNDVWNALRRQSPPAPALIPAFLACLRDPAAAYVLQDYSIQHLGALLDGNLDKLDPAQRDSALAALTEAAGMRSRGFAGTALYALQGLLPQIAGATPALSEELRDNLREELAQAALALLADPAANKLARISAFQISIENADPRAAVHARRIAADPASEPMLRAPAIAYLGRLGTSEDAALLQSLRAGCSDRRLLSALNPALARLAAGSTPATPAASR